MLSYGGSITSSFPNTFCSPPASLTCQLCNKNIVDANNAFNANGAGGSNGANGGVPNHHNSLYNLSSTSANGTSGSSGISSSIGNLNDPSNYYRQFQLPNRLEKCTHCGINVCERCLNENQEQSGVDRANENFDGAISSASPSSNLKKLNDSMENLNNTLRHNKHHHHHHHHHHSSQMSQSQVHYNTVKKEFKQMYNYSKEIVEKLHLLHHAIKVEETAVGELNSIKHQVNTKALELIKQINQEKSDLLDQIDNVKRKYES